MMKLNTCVLFGVCSLGAVFSSACSAQQPLVVTSSQQRERGLDQSTFKWQVTQDVTVADPSAKSETIVLKQAAEEARRDAAKQGITDQQAVEKFMQQRVSDVSDMERGYSITTTKLWQIIRNPNIILASGEMQNSPSYAGGFHEYYGQKFGIFVNDYGKGVATGESVSTLSPKVWGCSDDCAYFRNPFQDGLDLTPEDLAVLAGTNPLALYGAKWKVLAETPTTVVLAAEVRQHGNDPSSLQLTLDKSHSNAPSRLESQGSGDLKWSSTVRVTGFVKHAGGWISEAVDSTYDQSTQIVKRRWKLQSVEVSKPIDVTISRKIRVSDYRLLGENLSPESVTLASVNHDRRIASYTWPGHLPSLEQLKIISKQNLSSSVTSRNLAMASLPVLGGVLCLVGGIWMFKRRGEV